MKLKNIEKKFDRLLKQISAPGSTKFSTTVEAAYEALVLADVMNEYVRTEGAVLTIVPPLGGKFLNQAPGKFRTERAYRINFDNGHSYYFAADVELYGLGGTGGMLFEADVVVIPAEHVTTIADYPLPEHLSSVYECKFGKYSKAQLRELLGLRRHISYLSGNTRSFAAAADKDSLYGTKVMNANPPVPMKMVRPRLLRFFDEPAAALFDLRQLEIK